MKTLYVTDMDGTLLDGDSRVSERSAEIISDLTRQGAPITVADGEPFYQCGSPDGRGAPRHRRDDGCERSESVCLYPGG